MDLLTNAVEAVQVGIEDWQADTRPRLLSAVRSIHAGILLLFKEKLRRLSPADSNEVLVKARTRIERTAEGHIRHVGDGRRTVDSRAIQEHFESLGISTDWKRFKEIQSLRNEIEHYYRDVSEHSLTGLIADAFVIIRDFSIVELEEDPLSLFGATTWQLMLNTSAVYDLERKACDKLVGAVDWQSGMLLSGVLSIRCQSCGSDLLAPEEPDEPSSVELSCRQCGDTEDADSFIPRAVAAATEFQRYLAFDDGFDEPVADCPECYKPTYVDSENRCVYCSASVNRECARCSHSIPLGELGSAPLCGYCDHVMSKDD
ncbi:MAG: hypothetical protein JNL44_09950 [Gemmatimonadetes bacterium]|nr:hypothetical protein [Gemmatimonadota bacterium]